MPSTELTPHHIPEAISRGSIDNVRNECAYAASQSRFLNSIASILNGVSIVTATTAATTWILNAKTLNNDQKQASHLLTITAYGLNTLSILSAAGSGLAMHVQKRYVTQLCNHNHELLNSLNGHSQAI